MNAITLLISILLLMSVRTQLQAWAKHAQTFIKIAQQQAENIQGKQALLSGIDSVVGATATLQAAVSVDDMCRLAVELARDKLGVERCGILLFDLDKLNQVGGTYGTDLQGRTIDEHNLTFPYTDLAVAILSIRRGISSAWHYREDVDLYDTERKLIGTTWHVDTPILDFENKLIGVFCNDKAISKGQCNNSEQTMIAAFCAILGSLIDQKRASEREAKFSAGSTIHFLDYRGVVGRSGRRQNMAHCC